MQPENVRGTAGRGLRLRQGKVVASTNSAVAAGVYRFGFGGDRRHVRVALRGAAFARTLVLCAFAAGLVQLAAGLFAGAAQAQTTFVSNTGQSSSGNVIVGKKPGSVKNVRHAQGFTTGTNPFGYELTEVVASMGTIGNEARVQVKIYGVHSGGPGPSLYTLTNPASLASDSENTFTGNARLAPSTDYFVVFENSNNSSSARYRLSTTNTNTIDSGASSGWGMENVGYIKEGEDHWESTEQALKIAIRGTEAPPLGSARVVGSSLSLRYYEPLDENSIPARTAYTVKVDGGAGVRPTHVSVSGRTVTLTLPSTVASGQTVTVSYAVPSSNPVRDAGGSAAPALTDEPVTVQTAVSTQRPGNCGTYYHICTTVVSANWWTESGAEVRGYDEASGHGSIGTKTFSYIDRDTPNLDTTVNTIRRLVEGREYTTLVLDKFLPNGSLIYLNNDLLFRDTGGHTRVAGTSGTHRWRNHYPGDRGPVVQVKGRKTMSIVVNWPRRNRSPLLEARMTIGEIGVRVGGADGVERGGKQVSPRGFRYLLPRERTESSIFLPVEFAVTELVVNHAVVRLGVGVANPSLADLVGDLVLEWAGETLPLNQGQILGGAGAIEWDQAWLNANASSLNAANYKSTLPVGQSVGLCLRAPGQTCPSSTAVASAPRFAADAFREVPVMGSGTETAPRPIGKPLTATDTRRGTLVYSLSGLDGGKFTIDENGQMWTKAGETYEWSSPNIKRNRVTVTVTNNATGVSAKGDRVIFSIAEPLSALPALSVADTEKNESASPMRFTVTLAWTPRWPVTVDWETADGTAVAGEDYTAASGTLTFARGERSKRVSVRLIDDTIPDDGETLSLLLDSSKGATISDGEATGTIRNTEGLAASFENVPESHDGSEEFTLRVSFSEAVATGFVRMRDEAFTVTGGSVTSAKRVERRSDLWDIRIEPSGSGAVTVNLPATTGECSATGAICTSGGLKLSGTVSAEIAGPPVTPLTASFSEVPAEHDGSSAFTLKLTFSDEPDGLGFRTVRDNLFTATGGTVVRAKRTEQGSNLGFRLTVEPSGNDAVTLSLATPLPACGQSGAVCTADGRALTGTVTATVQGPPSLAVEDAAVDEGPGAALAFTVTLSRAASGTVTVDYATSDGTAVAGQDYTAATGTLSFAAGETEKTVSVTVLDDVHDDPGETLTLTLTNATGAWIEDGTATGTIRNSDAMPRAWLARFGRTVADQVIEAVEGRMAAARSPGAEVSVGGQKIGGGAAADDLESREAAAKLKALTGWLRGEDGGDKAGSTLGFRPVTARDLMTGSSFELTGGTAEGGFGAVWGRGAVTRFDGVEGELTLDGEVASGMAGVDFTRGRGMVGLAVAHSRGEGGYQSPIRNGEVESSLTGLYPWGRYAVSERLTVWGMAGYGSGTLTLTPEGMPAMETDMDLAMGAVGARGVLVKAAAEGGLELAAKTDALLVRTTSDEVDGSADTLAASEADVTRVRLGLEGTWLGIGTGGGGSLVPTLEVGVRQDGGDAETGGGMDIGAGLSWTEPSLGIRAEVSGRALLTHAEEGFRERGFAGSLAWDPNQDSERGPSLTLSQNVGASATGGMDTLLNHRTLEGLAANDGSDGPDRRHLKLKLGYGVAAFGDRFTSTPELGLGLTDAGREVSLGWRLARDRQSGDSGSAELLLEGRRRESANHKAEAEHSVGFRVTVQF